MSPVIRSSTALIISFRGEGTRGTCRISLSISVGWCYLYANVKTSSAEDNVAALMGFSKVDTAEISERTGLGLRHFLSLVLSGQMAKA